MVIPIGPPRGWIFLWLISLTGLLWAAFLLARGGWVWVGAWLFLAIVGSNILVMAMRLS